MLKSQYVELQVPVDDVGTQSIALGFTLSCFGNGVLRHRIVYCSQSHDVWRVTEGISQRTPHSNQIGASSWHILAFPANAYLRSWPHNALQPTGMFGCGIPPLTASAMGTVCGYVDNSARDFRNYRTIATEVDNVDFKLSHYGTWKAAALERKWLLLFAPRAFAPPVLQNVPCSNIFCSQFLNKECKNRDSQGLEKKLGNSL